MDLKGKLEQFNKRQQECQFTLTSIAAEQAAHKANVAPPFTGQAPVVPTLKFSMDTDRFQHVKSIRKAPVGAQIKRVIDLLFETRKGFTPEQINETCYVDVNSMRAVFDSLKNNLKVHYDGKRFSYKAKHDVRNKNGLLELIKKYQDGIAVIDLKDAYPNVMEDLQGLKAAGQIWLLSNFDSHEDIAYPNEYERLNMKVDDDLRKLYKEIELPRDMLDIEKELQKNGMKPATNTAARRASAQMGILAPKTKPKKKQRELNKRSKLTNTHLPELLQHLRS